MSIYYTTEYENRLYENGCLSYVYEPNILFGDSIQVYVPQEDIVTSLGNGKYSVQKFTERG
jgi:hypothetical protein